MLGMQLLEKNLPQHSHLIFSSYFLDVPTVEGVMLFRELMLAGKLT